MILSLQAQSITPLSMLLKCLPRYCFYHGILSNSNGCDKDPI